MVRSLPFPLPRIVLFSPVLLFLTVWLAAPGAARAEAPLSPETEQCLSCHEYIHPGIVGDWRASRHAQITPGEAIQVEGLALKVSSKEAVPQELRDVAVGCAECHLLRPEAHADTFDHMGEAVHIVVSPDDCATCHVEERDQYSQNLMSRAYGNLVNNPVYMMLATASEGAPTRTENGIEFTPANAETSAESCLYCHGTVIEVNGTEVRDTDMGEFEIPVLTGWPNQGSGRVNPDGSLGACTPCHTRHLFSIAEARSPSTCKECHIGPDVPAAKVYEASKHGTIFYAKGQEFEMDAVPWKVGEDFRAPTCGGCHVSLLTDGDGTVIAERDHSMATRLPWRIFGLIYAHPSPKSPDTSIIVNSDGLPLPTTLDGEFAMDYLIDAEEQAKRAETMQTVCRSCHGRNWVDGFWNRFENTIQETNEKTLFATQLMLEGWEKGYNTGPADGGNPFDEHGERLWSGLWLFSANSVRFASAMAGGGDYGVFADGRYHMTDRTLALDSWLSDEAAKAKAKADAGTDADEAAQ